MQLKEKHLQKRQEIEHRLDDFKKSFEQNDEHVFGELCFCLFTPQSKAKSCWHAIEKLKSTKLLYTGNQQDIKKWMAAVRFNENKSRYVIEARGVFSSDGKIKIKESISSFSDIFELREWLIKNVKGLGYKEASHFLRNIGYGENIAILDRHILKNLLKNKVIDEIPATLTAKKYLEIEEKMRRFAQKTEIPLSHLDLLWWSEETGEIFK